MRDLLIILDPGHGRKTPGKASPDGSLQEWANNRELAHKISMIAKSRDILVKWTVADDSDPSLTTRARVANSAYTEFKQNNPKGKGVFISLHSDAFGDGTVWTSPNGFAVWTTRSNNNSDKLASEIWKSVDEGCAKKYGINMRKNMDDGDEDYESNFTVIFKANCPAVLIEDLFHTNRDDVELLKNENYLTDVANCIVEGIENWSKKKR